MGEALRALEKALLIHLVYPQTSAILPLLPDVGKSPRLHVLDTGMLNYFLGVRQEIIGSTDLSHVYKGTIIEHITGQELLASQFSALHGLAFWVREKTTSSAEVDYLYKFREKLVPIEVKSGSTGKLRSLFQFMDMTSHNLAVRVNAGELQITNVTTPGGKKVQLLNLPYYLVSQMEGYLGWMRVC